MAEEAGNPAAEEQLEFLFRKAKEVSFFQAILALEHLFPDSPALGHEGPASHELIRIRPSVSLSCPPSDLESIQPMGEQQIQVTATFLGLYGSDSPLPYTYSEHLAQISMDPGGHRVRAFLDMFHHRLYSLLYRAWRKSRLIPTLSDEAGSGAVDPLYDRVLALIGFSSKLGLGGDRLPRLSEARLQVLRARTARGLELMLRQRLGYPCDVQQLQQRQVEIPASELTTVGQRHCRLGQDMLMGSKVTDCNQICVAVEATSFEMFEDLLPDADGRRDLDDVLNSYLRDPVDFAIEVTLAAEHVPSWQLGRQGALGRTVWLSKPRPWAVCRWR